MMEMLQHRHKA